MKCPRCHGLQKNCARCNGTGSVSFKPRKQTDPNSVERVMIRDIESVGHLNDWEESFLLSITERLDSGRPLTEGQLDKLWELHDERT